MVDGAGGFRPHWRWLLGALAALGREEMAARATLMDRFFADEEESGLVAGAAPQNSWRCDPIPLVLAAGEFDALVAGLAQRASLLELVLRDVYGPQTLLAEGVLPPALVYANPAFLRPCRVFGERDGPMLQLYAADLLRAPDGQWRVLADRTAGPTGLAQALENRRAMARHLPELVRARELRRLQPFFDLWQDSLQRLAPSGEGNPGVAMLTEGHSSPYWTEHVLLARALSCALVEAGDLTVRDGVVYLKTLRGLQRVDVLLRRKDGRRIDPLEADQSARHGVPGLFEAARGGAVRIVNDPGAGFAEAPVLAERLLGAPLLLPSARTLWLGDPVGRAEVGEDLGRWLVRHAVDGTVASVTPAAIPKADRQKLAQSILAAPEDFAVSEVLPASVAPCAAATGMIPRPVVLRLFLMFDGAQWQAMQGGLARTLADPDKVTGRRAATRFSKDVWVPAEDTAEIQGPPQLSVPALTIRRGSGDLPSRVADNFFWLGRYLERLEAAARLLRSAATRLTQTTPSPREMAELRSLAACLVRADLLDAETAKGQAGALAAGPVTRALLRAAREDGPMLELLGEVSRLTDLLRDRLTGEVHLALNRGLRQLAEQLRGLPGREGSRGLEALAEVSANVLGFAATVAGLTAENMVRGGGRLFLDLGRRVERAQAIVAELSRALDQPGAGSQPARLEPGLRLALELRDSVITYRSRYLTVLQAAPVLDLVLAEEGNPRGLAFQLATARDMLRDLEGEAVAPLAEAAEALLEEARAMVRDVAEAQAQAEAAMRLAPRLKAMEGAVSALSDRISRRWFTLLPAQHALGSPLGEAPETRLRGAA